MGKPKGSLDLISCAVYLNGWRLEDSAEVLEATGYSEDQYKEFIDNITRFN